MTIEFDSESDASEFAKKLTGQYCSGYSLYRKKITAHGVN